MKNNTPAVRVASKLRKVKPFSMKNLHVKTRFFTLIGLTIVSTLAFVFTHTLHKKVKIRSSEKKQLVNELSTLRVDLSEEEREKVELVNQIRVLRRDLDRSEVIEDLLKDRLKDIEEKLLDMQELLDKKGIGRELALGGEFIPADEMSLSYADSIERDVDELFDVMKDFPIGIPLAGEINSEFGYRKDPLNSKSAFHSGVDIDAIYGEPVIATADGIVKDAGWYRGYGKTVIVEHKYEFQTLYGHLSKVEVKEGQKVKAGDMIGRTGSTGRSSGVHLHYEIIKNGKKINPTKYLSLM